MKCSNCGKEMRKGYLFSSKDGAFSFANEVPGVFENAKNADGFVEIKNSLQNKWHSATITTEKTSWR